MDEVNHPIPQFYMFNLEFASACWAGEEINQTRPNTLQRKGYGPRCILFLIRRLTVCARLNPLLCQMPDDIDARVVHIFADGNERRAAPVVTPLGKLADAGNLPQCGILRAVKPRGIKSEG